jgi:hypothetical protein
VNIVEGTVHAGGNPLAVGVVRPFGFPEPEGSPSDDLTPRAVGAVSGYDQQYCPFCLVANLVLAVE